MGEKINSEALKKMVAEAVLDYIEPGIIIGVGSGSTMGHFMTALKAVRGKIEGAVASSNKTAEKLKELSIPLYDLNNIGELPLYIDSADEVNAYKQMIKGAGGALTREKIIAAASKKFVCIVDMTKQTDLLGQCPVPIEVIPLARSYVARCLVKLGGDPVYRQGFVTDNGNIILDVHNLKCTDPVKLEQELNNIAGVVANGLFAVRPADMLLIATPTNVVVS